jgi:two-component system chemotaxis sensor kinase CheA
MPKMDGLTFVKKMKQETAYKQIPVIVVSGIHDPDMRQEFAAEGVNSYIIKSDFDRGNLVAEVNKLLNV